jgi:hypothetical protein
MIKRHLAGLIVAALVGGGGAAAWAAAPSGDQAPAASGSTHAARPDRKAGHRGDILRRAVHGDLIVRGRGGAYENVTLDKGIVQAKGDHTITLKRPDGPAVTVKVDDDTRYRGVDSFDAIKTGQRAIVVAKDGTALMFGQREPGRNNANRSNVGVDEEQVPAT